VGERRVDGGLLLHVEHLEGEHGRVARGGEAPHQPGLQEVVVGVVVPLAQQHEARPGERLQQRRLLQPAALPRVPDAAHQRVLAVQGAPPRFHPGLGRVAPSH
jgi:hypothetical protein